MRIIKIANTVANSTNSAFNTMVKRLPTTSPKMMRNAPIPKRKIMVITAAAAAGLILGGNSRISSGITLIAFDATLHITRLSYQEPCEHLVGYQVRLLRQPQYAASFPN